MVGLGNGDLVVRIDFIRHVVHVLGHASQFFRWLQVRYPRYRSSMAPQFYHNKAVVHDLTLNSESGLFSRGIVFAHTL